MDTFGYTFFSDDIRYEMGGKRSYIGCYRGGMVVGDSFPVTLPRLCISTFLVRVATKPLQTAIFRVFMGDDIVAEINQRFPSVEEQLASIGGLKPAQDSHKVLTSQAEFHLTPFTIEAEGLIRVRAEIDGGEIIRLGALRIASAPPSETDPEPGRTMS